jgi:hypothetical protein
MFQKIIFYQPKKNFQRSLFLLFQVVIFILLTCGSALVAAEPTGSITGKIMDKEGNPVAGAWVFAYLVDGRFEDVKTDSHGNYTIHKLIEGTYTVIVYPPKGCGLAPEQSFGILVTQGETINLNITLLPEGRISGKVTTEKGTPVGSVRIDVTNTKGIDRKTKTKPNGNYTVSGLPRGSYRVYIFPLKGSGLANLRVNDVSVAPGKTTILNITLPPEGKISGKVTDRRGNPVEGALLSARREDGWSAGCAKTNSNGDYTIFGLPQGTYTVNAYPPSGSNLLGVMQVKDVTVTPEKTSTVNFSFYYSR